MPCAGGAGAEAGWSTIVSAGKNTPAQTAGVAPGGEMPARQGALFNGKRRQVKEMRPAFAGLTRRFRSGL